MATTFDMSRQCVLLLALTIGGQACGKPPAPTTTLPASTGTTAAAADASRARLAADDPTVAATEIVALARAGERATLERLVDWDYVAKLARTSGAFAATLDDLISTTALEATCTPAWTTDDGGHRLDFPPAMVDDPDDVAAEKDEVKAELYQGVDVVASCGERERLVIQLVRGANASWVVRGWARL